MATKKERITEKAFELLEAMPHGIQFSDLVAQLHAAFPEDPHGTITGTIWNLDARFPEQVYKPSRGLFRITKFQEEVVAPQQQIAPPNVSPITGTPREVAFYEPFADYLVNDLEECTKAISLGGNKFGGKWGTPDVFGILRARESDIVKSPLEVIVAEVKTDTSQLITAFGQACAYKLFAHRSYLVVPREAQPEDIGRLDALCTIFGIGLILFDPMQPENPAFIIRVRAAKNDPDPFYVNQNIKLIADQLDL
jgi:hypothetical protein